MIGIHYIYIYWFKHAKAALSCFLLISPNSIVSNNMGSQMLMIIAARLDAKRHPAPWRGKHGVG